MPIEYTKNYRRIRKESPTHFIRSSFRTVPISHTKLKNRYKKKGTKAIVGRYKRKYKKRYAWGVNSILIPRRT